jgi:hypothetical protein
MHNYRVWVTDDTNVRWTVRQGEDWIFAYMSTEAFLKGSRWRVCWPSDVIKATAG